MIALRHSCFVSYYRGQYVLIRQFMNDLIDALSSSLEPYLPRELGVYLDTEFDPGVRFPREIARALCRSLCMVLVYTPQYRRSEMCRREYAAMKALEDRRLEQLQRMGVEHGGKGMIIPIILRGAEDLPAQLRDHVNCLDFSRYTTADQRILKHRRYIESIERIASHVFDLYCMFERADDARRVDDVEHMDCEKFELPSEPLHNLWPASGPVPLTRFPH